MHLVAVSQLIVVCSVAVYFSLAVSHYISACTALPSPLLCHIIMCDVTGLARDPTYIKGSCLLPSACTLFLLLFTICHKLFFILCSDQGCSITSLYRMSCIKPYTIGKNLGALLHWHTSASFTFCCIYTYMWFVKQCSVWKHMSVFKKGAAVFYERGWDILWVQWLSNVNLAAYL